ncbi:MAG: acetate--CoA ligase family protein [Candidatus Thioglobus sp.]|nr:acetate--CoA ligase family protein [Candidatus Thioglobus sp.]
MSQSDLMRLISPRSIAVVGHKGADFAIRETLRMGYSGQIWSVHPTRESIAGLDCYRSIKDLPQPPDATFIAVNAESAIDIVAELNEMGGAGAVIYASGFAEVGDDGSKRNQRLIDAAANMPIIGPNCYGFINSLDRVALWPDLHGCEVLDKGVAIITQSGNIGLNMTMQSIGLPLAYMFTLGNQASINITDIMQAVLEDERVNAIGLHIESIKDIAAFDAVGRLALKKKIPIVAIKSGRTAVSAKIALSHTSSLTGVDELFDVLFERLGIARVDTVPEFLETLKLFSMMGPIEHNRVASMSCSGGEAGMMADLIDGLDISFPSLENTHKEGIKKTLNEYVEVENPLDYHTFVWGDRDRTAACFKEMMSGDFAATMLLLDWPKTDQEKQQDWDNTLLALCDAAKETGKNAIVLASMADCMPKRIIEECRKYAIVPMIGLDTCLKSLHHAYRCSKAFKRVPLPAIKLVGQSGDKEQNYRTLNEYQGKRLLSGYGLSIPQGGLVSSTKEALQTAEKLNYPVVIKVSSDAMVHKTEMGAVRVNIKDDDALKLAATELLNIGSSLLVENMIEDAVAEFIVGVNTDPSFGNYLVIGSGGVLVGLVGDSVPLLLPIERRDVLYALSQLKLYPLLKGYRGKPAGDLEALVDAVMSVVELINSNRVAELDINPLLVLPRGKGAIAVDALVKLRQSG